MLDQGERDVAAAENVRFVDMVHGFYGHEICARGTSHSQEWVGGLKYDPNSSDWWNEHAVQQSFHPNAQGHTEIVDCVDGFAPQTYREGICEIGGDGNLYVQPHP